MNFGSCMHMIKLDDTRGCELFIQLSAVRMHSCVGASTLRVFFFGLHGRSMHAGICVD
jgi:hypothetical protein